MGLSGRTAGPEAQAQGKKEGWAACRHRVAEVRSTRDTRAQGDGTRAAHGSDAQQRGPRAGGSRRPGEAEEEEVAVTAGGRGGRDTPAGPYLSRRQRRRRRRSSGSRCGGGGGEGPPAWPTWYPGHHSAPTPATGPVASSSPMSHWVTFLAGDPSPAAAINNASGGRVTLGKALGSQAGWGGPGASPLAAGSAWGWGE